MKKETVNQTITDVTEILKKYESQPEELCTALEIILLYCYHAMSNGAGRDYTIGWFESALSDLKDEKHQALINHDRVTH